MVGKIQCILIRYNPSFQSLFKLFYVNIGHANKKAPNGYDYMGHHSTTISGEYTLMIVPCPLVFYIIARTSHYACEVSGPLLFILRPYLLLLYYSKIIQYNFLCKNNVHVCRVSLFSIDILHEPCLCYQLQSIEQNMYELL